MQKKSWIAIPLLLLVTCSSEGTSVDSDRKALAERFFRGVYGGDPSVVDDLAGAEIVVSYPIFQEMFETPAIRGRAAVRDFASGFGQRWADASITFHEAVVEKDRVVLVWSFRARSVGSSQPNNPPSNEEHAWGGITLYRFDTNGKIVAEIGEESVPGPVARLAADNSSR
jgi:hypothetical protein